MKKRTLSLFLAMTMVATLSACGGSGGNTNANNNPPAQSSAASGSNAGQSADLTPITAGLLEGPVLITSVGQSADVAIVNTLFGKADIETTQNNTLAADEFDTKYQTLVLAIGGSSKGLGAAGIDENQELERVSGLISAAQDNGTKILAIHVGGSARRGVLSDMFIPDSLKAADAAIILSEGDSDNYMRDILAAEGVPTEYIESQMDSLAVIQTLFGN